MVLLRKEEKEKEEEEEETPWMSAKDEVTDKHSVFSDKSEVVKLNGIERGPCTPTRLVVWRYEVKHYLTEILLQKRFICQLKIQFKLGHGSVSYREGRIT